MPKSAQQVEESLGKMKRLGRRLTALFTALLALIAVGGAIVLGITVAGLLGGRALDPSHTVTAVTGVLYLAICGVGAFIMRGISADMARGASPFTVSHAHGICVLGWAFVAVALIELAFSPGFIAVAAGPVTLISAPQAMVEPATLPIDMGAVLGAVACFSVAAIWRYGALLQEQAEDLV